jgi:HPt (histidine-containing phosphotransfer) domain-containing protein
MPSALKTTPLIIHADPELADIIPGYLESRIQEMGVFETALAQADHDRIRTMAHKIRGTGSSYGFEGLTSLGHRLEDAATSRDVPTMTALIAELRDYLGSIQVVYPKVAA